MKATWWAIAAVLRLRVQVVKQMGLRRAPMLLAHPSAGPLLLGITHPVIIVPEAMLIGDGEELRLALAHELAHVRRRDILWGWLPALASFFFFHPLLYPARRECRLAQEIACDAEALSRTDASPRDYGAMLLKGYPPYHLSPGADSGGHSRIVSNFAEEVKRHEFPLHAGYLQTHNLRINHLYPGIAGPIALAACCRWNLH